MCECSTSATPRPGPVADAELPRAFNRQSVGKRFAIVMAGPIANLLLAIFVYWLLNVIGVFEPRATLGTPPAATVAARAGVAAGDTVTEVDGAAVRSWNELRWLLLQKAVAGAPIAIEVEGADRHRRTLTLEPGEADRRGPRVGRRRAPRHRAVQRSAANQPPR